MSELLKKPEHTDARVQTLRRIDLTRVDFSDPEVRRRLGRVYALLHQYRRLQSESVPAELFMPTPDSIV